MEYGGPEPDALRALWAADPGAVRDIYANETTSSDWQRAVDAIQERWSCSYTEDGAPVPMPPAAEILRRRSDRSTVLVIHLEEHLDMRAYFFESDQIEFSFQPRDVRDDADVYRVLDFVLQLGRTLGRTLHMTVESFVDERPPDDLRYDPAQDRVVSTPEP